MLEHNCAANSEHEMSRDCGAKEHHGKVVQFLLLPVAEAQMFSRRAYYLFTLSHGRFPTP